MTAAVRENPRRTEPRPYDGFDRMLMNVHTRPASGPVTEHRDAQTEDVLVRIHVAQDDEVDEAYRAGAAGRGRWACRLPPERAAVLRRGRAAAA